MYLEPLFMDVLWKDLYHQALKQHQPLPQLRARALQAVECSGSETLRAQMPRYQVMPIYVVCVELDRYQIRPPAR